MELAIHLCKESATEKAQEAIAILQKVAHLAAIVESSDDAIISKTLEGIVISWNAGAEHLYGYGAADMTGRSMTLLLPADRTDEEALILARIRRGERVEHFETVRCGKNGAMLDVSLSISPIRDAGGEIVAASHVARNITDQKQMIAQLGRLAAIVESSEDAIVSKTLDSKILTWNAAAEHVYGYTAAEAVGLPMTLVLPGNRSDEETEILDRIRRGERVEHYETVRRRKDGSLIDVSLTVSPVRDDFGRIVGASHAARDITERKLLVRQLHHAQKLESLGVLAGGVAHDFNNLLTSILGNASLALDTLPGNHPARPMLGDVIKSSEAAALLTRQMLAYAGKGKFIVGPIQLSELTKEVSSLIQTSIPRNVQLRLDLAAKLPPIEADASQLLQLIMNLTMNAAEAIRTDENGVVFITTALHHESGDNLPYVALEVRDTGAGMDEATIARIFEPFFTTKFTGRGLGLAAVQGIVRGHKGMLKIKSVPGKGTTFKVLFPAARSAIAHQPPRVAHAH